jgi:hypothetical protein
MAITRRHVISVRVTETTLPKGVAGVSVPVADLDVLGVWGARTGLDKLLQAHQEGAHFVLQWKMNSTGLLQPSCLNRTIVKSPCRFSRR